MSQNFACLRVSAGAHDYKRQRYDYSLIATGTISVWISGLKSKYSVAGPAKTAGRMTASCLERPGLKRGEFINRKLGDRLGPLLS